MTCSICGKKGKLEYKKEKLCDGCFCRIIEKRIRKNARINKLFSKGDKILVQGDLAELVLKDIIKGLPVKIFKRKAVNKEFIKKNKIDKIVVNWTMDDEIINFLKNFFDGKKEKKDKKVVKLLKVVSDEDLKNFSKIKKIKFVPNKKDKNIVEMVEYMAERYPDTKEKLLNSAIALGKMGI